MSFMSFKFFHEEERKRSPPDGGAQLPDLSGDVPLGDVPLPQLQLVPLLQTHAVRLEGERERGELVLDVAFRQVASAAKKKRSKPGEQRALGTT